MRLLGLFVCFVSFLGFVGAQTIQMQAAQTQLTVDTPVQVTIQIADATQAGEVFIQGIEQFDILGQSQSQSIQLINGQQSTQVQLQLQIQPKKSGTVVLGPAMITGGSGSVQSNSLTFTVTGERLFLQPGIKQQTVVKGEEIEGNGEEAEGSGGSGGETEGNGKIFGNILRWLAGLFVLSIVWKLFPWIKKQFTDTLFGKKGENESDQALKREEEFKKIKRPVSIPGIDAPSFWRSSDERLRDALSTVTHRDGASLSFGELEAVIQGVPEEQKALFSEGFALIQQAQYAPQEPDRETMHGIMHRLG